MGYSVLFLYRAFKQKDAQYNKMKRNFLLLYDWMDMERTGDNVLASILRDMGYREIIIYGWGYLGERLYRELENSQIKIKGILDKRYVNNFYHIPTYTLQNKLPSADAVIVAVLYDREKIKTDIAKLVNCPVIGLEEIL